MDLQYNTGAFLLYRNPEQMWAPRPVIVHQNLFWPTIIILYMHQNLFWATIMILYIYASEFVFNQLRSFIIFFPHQPHLYRKTHSCSVYNVLLTPPRRDGAVWGLNGKAAFGGAVSDFSAVFFIFVILDLSRNTDKYKCKIIEINVSWVGQSTRWVGIPNPISREPFYFNRTKTKFGKSQIKLHWRRCWQSELCNMSMKWEGERYN